ncbi:MAG: chorismate synthase [Lachnospiraceae bacterium]|nr:chorismate synthase [Lachnospiraceae bacterium]MBR5918260.1 chorismate synthase [Lachnospiraceae bacterium]
MKNTFGQSLQTTIFGESHGPYIGVVLDGLAPGIEVNDDFIKEKLSLRRPAGAISTARVEADEYTFASGVFNGKTTGTPLCILIPNTNTRSADYDKAGRVARPGHADYTAMCKYHGFEDYRGGGHFSGRITAAIVAGGAIAMSALEKKGILIGSHIYKLSDLSDREFSDIKNDIDILNKKSFAVLDEEVAEKMIKAIEDAAKDADSVGGVLETAITGLPAGVGEPWFDSVESILSHVLFSVPGIKGVQFGAGFDKVCERGSSFNDALRNEDGKVVTATNNNGGINGGITNGMPVIIKCAVKPTPSIYKEQKSINLNTLENSDIAIEGRHDPAIIHRARVVVDSVCALAVYDMLAARFGTDYFTQE